MTAQNLNPHDFKQLADMHRSLAADEAVFASARAGLEASMSEWLKPFASNQATLAPALKAMGSLVAEQVDAAVQQRGADPINRLYELCRPRLVDLDLNLGTLRAIEKETLDILVDEGFVYAPEGAFAAEAWLSRGARHGEAAFRKRYPRKSPLIAFWEIEGLILPRMGLCNEGRELVVSELARMKGRAMTEGINKTLRAHFRADWRVVLCLMLSDIDLPLSMDVQLSNVFGRERKLKILDLFRPGKSSHAELERLRKLRDMPSVAEVLEMPGKPDMIDPYLQPGRVAA